jgi:hypothetical protein
MVLPVFGIMPFSLCIFLCFSHVCLLRRPVEAKPVQTQSISERDLGRARCLLWFGGQLWRQPQSTRVENIFLGFLFLSVAGYKRSGHTDAPPPLVLIVYEMQPADSSRPSIFTRLSFSACSHCTSCTLGSLRAWQSPTASPGFRLNRSCQIHYHIHCEGAARAVRAVHRVYQGMCVWLHP